jgi:hypothetical protein
MYSGTGGTGGTGKYRSRAGVAAVILLA